MTFGNIKHLVSAILPGDYVLPEVKEEQLMLLNYSYLKIATEADALKLFTVGKGESILREGQGGMFVRMPKLPDEDSDVLDIDDELGYAAAEFMAGFISKEKKSYHDREAKSLIRDYNSKVDSYLSSIAEDEYYKNQVSATTEVIAL